MRSRLILPIVAAALVFVASSNAQAGCGLFGNLWGHHGGCGQQSCCAPEPSCCTPEPTCCAPEPTCCAPEPTCCDSGCGHRHGGLFKKLFGWLNHNKGGCGHSSCCEPTCCTPEPTCCGH